VALLALVHDLGLPELHQMHAILKSTPLLASAAASALQLCQATPYATGALALWRHANADKLGSGRQVLDAAKNAFITTAAAIKVANDSRFAYSVVQAGAGGFVSHRRSPQRLWKNHQEHVPQHVC
jgi:hypothetical protein